MKQYKLENSPIAYYISGREHTEWVLFLHAAFVDHHMFQKQAAYFQNQYNLLTLDIIGHGNSVDTKKGDGIDQMSGWIHGILKKEGIDRIHIVGISLGAVLAQDFANRYPKAVQSLACFGGYDINNFDLQLQKKNGMAQMGMIWKAVFSVKWFAKSNQKISAYTRQAQNEFYQMNIRFPKKSFRYFASLNSMINVRQTAPREYPLLIGCGRHDIPAEIAAVEMWKKNEPGCKGIIFEGAGHCVNLDVPQQFHQALAEFWKSAGGKR